MSQPTPEAYEAAGQAYDEALDRNDWSPPYGMFKEINRAGLNAVVDAVWPLASAAGRQAAAAEIRAAGEQLRSEVSGPDGYGGHYRTIEADQCERLARRIEGSTDENGYPVAHADATRNRRRRG